jgi:hypothetical protein
MPEEGFMANLGDDQREITVLNRALEVAAAENRRLIDENVRLRAELAALREQEPVGVFADVNRHTVGQSPRWEQMFECTEAKP